MNFISSPIHFTTSERSVGIARDIEERITMMDNLVELIAFTPRGSFNADPDFGMEFWNQEYSNVNDEQFNNNNTGRDEYHPESLKERCEMCIAESLMAYAPESLQVRDIKVLMNLQDTGANHHGSHKVYSHHEVVLFISAKLDDGLGTTCDYSRELSFMVEPTMRSRKI